MAIETKSARERRWRGELADWKTSGLSQAAYCRRRGLSQNDFSWWKRELARRDQRATACAPAFVPVRVTALQTQGFPFELAMRDGRVLRFGASVDPAALAAVVRELEAAGLKTGAGRC